MSQSIQLQVTQVGLEQSIAAAMKRVGSSSQINLGTSSKQINALSQPLGRITGQADEFSKSMAAANARVLAFGASAGIIAGVSKAMSGLLTSTIKVEKSLVEISTVLNKTGSELDKFGQDIFNVAKNTGKSFDEVAKGALELARQGLNAEDTLARLNDALILSRLSGLDATQSVEGLTAAFNSFKSSGITTAEILNKVVAAAQKYAVSERDIIEGLKRSASVANLAGVSFEELAAVITAVQEKTARGGAVIGNAFKTIFSRIQDKAVLSDLQDMRVGVTDLQGEVLPALKILENLAKKMGSFSQIEQADIAKKLGGVYQLDKLLAALNDLSDEASVTTGALKAMGEAGSKAYQKNAVLNQTLAALLNKVAVSAEQLGAKLGEIGVTDSLKNVLGFFNGLLEGIQKVLGEESGLGNLVRGLVKGLGSFLAGPGLALFGGIILKLSKDLVQFGFASLKAFFGIGKAAKEVQNVEGSISQILAKNVNLQQQLFALEGNRAAQLRVITGALVEQEALLRRSANISSGLGAPLYNAGVRARESGLRIGNSAGGYMPAVAKESKAIKQGVGGARAGDKPVVMPNFNFGGGKKGTMVAHTGEYVVPNFNGSGGSAVFNRRMVQSMGLPSGAKKINAAGGLVPNFANVVKKDNLVEFKNYPVQEVLDKKGSLQQINKVDSIDQFSGIVEIVEQKRNSQEYTKAANRLIDQFWKKKDKKGNDISVESLDRILSSMRAKGIDEQYLKRIKTSYGKKDFLALRNNFKGALGELDAQKISGDNLAGENSYMDLLGGGEVKTTARTPFSGIASKIMNHYLSSGPNLRNFTKDGKPKLDKVNAQKMPLYMPRGGRVDINAARGFIPNFAEAPRPKAIDDEIRKYVEAGNIENYIRPGKDDFGRPYRSYWFPDGTQAAPSQVERVMKSSRAVGAVRKEEFEKKVEDSKPLTLSADQLGGIALISPRFGGNGIGSLDTQMKIAEIGGGLIYAKGAALASRKNSYLKLTGIKTTATPMKQTVDGENGLEGAIGDTFAQGIVDLAYKLYGRVFAQKTNWVDELKTLATKQGQQLLPPAAQGDLFEAAGKVAVNTLADVNAKDKEGKSIGIFSGTEQNRPFDFSNSAGIKEIFGINAQRGEAKRGGEANFEGSNQVKGIIKKVFNDSVYAERANKLLTKQIDEENLNLSKAEKAVQAKNAFGGFIPNFANPLQDAVNREMSAGVPASQIYVDKSPALKNAANPMGLMVANRRDEPAGGFQGINRAIKEGADPKSYGAASGFIPNFNDYKLLKQGKDSKREILDKASRSYLQYSKNNDNLEIKTAFSYQKGSMLGLYNNLGEIAKKSGKKLFSERIVAQRDRLKSFNENSSIEEILKAVYPQLVYREKSNSKNTKLKLYLGGNSTDLSGKNIFQQVANYFKNTSPTSPKDLLSSIEDRRVSITSLVDTFADGYIPNFAYQLKKSPKSDIRSIVSGQSELHYEASESAKRGKYLDMVGIHSEKPGQGFELFKRLAKIAKRSGRKIYSSSLLPQDNRLRLLNESSSINQILKLIYPQLSYRQKSQPENTKLDFEFGQIEKQLSGKNIFDLVANEFKNVKSGELIEAIQNKRVGFSSIIDTFAGGFIPNFANPLQAAVGREMAAGIPASQIYIDKNSSLKNAANPMGLMVANRRDEPAGGFQGINRARREGANPMMYGAAGGFVPNYAAGGSGPDLSPYVGKTASQATAQIQQELDAILKKIRDEYKKELKALQQSGKLIKDRQNLEEKAIKAERDALAKRIKQLRDAERTPNLTATDKINIAGQKGQIDAQRSLIRQRENALDAEKAIPNTKAKDLREARNKERKTAQDDTADLRKAVQENSKKSVTNPFGKVREASGGNRDMLGTLFAVQGAMTALTGATEGATNGFAKFANSFGAVASSVSTVVFAGQGLSQAFGGAEKGIGRVVGKLGVYGAAAMGVYTGFQELAKYLDSTNPEIQKTSEAMSRVSDAASKAAINLNNINPATKARFETESEASLAMIGQLSEAGRTTSRSVSQGLMNFLVGTGSVSANRKTDVTAGIGDDLEKNVLSTMSQARGVGMTQESINEILSKYAREGELNYAGETQITAQEAEKAINEIRATVTRIADKASPEGAYAALDKESQKKLQSVTQEQLDFVLKNTGKISEASSLAKEEGDGSALAFLMANPGAKELTEARDMLFNAGVQDSAVLDDYMRKIFDLAQTRKKQEEEARKESERTSQINLGKLQAQIALENKLASFRKTANDLEIDKLKQEGEIKNNSRLAEDQKAKAIAEINNGYDVSIQALQTQEQKIKNIEQALIDSVGGGLGVIPTEIADTVARIQGKLPEFNTNNLDDYVKRLRDALDISDVMLNNQEAIVQAVIDAEVVNKGLTEQQREQLQLSLSRLGVELKTVDVARKIAIEEAKINSMMESAKSIDNFNLEKRSLDIAYDTLSINKQIEKVKRDSSLNELEKAKQIFKLEEKRVGLEKSKITVDYDKSANDAAEEFKNSVLNTAKDQFGIQPKMISGSLSGGAEEVIKAARGKISKPEEQKDFDNLIANERKKYERDVELAKRRRDIDKSGVAPALESDVQKRAREGFSGGMEEGVNKLQDSINTFGFDIAEKIPQMFSDNMSSAINKMIEGGESFGNVLQGAAYEFVKGINQANIQNLSNKFSNFLFKSDGGAKSGIASMLGMASGGKVTGGSGSKDDVPAMLMGGEYVVNKRAVSKYGPKFLEAINNGTLNGYAKGGKVQRGPQGNFYAPGSFGQGAISGKMNLLDFATQTGTSGKFDQMINESGYQSISLEPESSRLSVSGMRNSPMFDATQSAKGQAFDLYLQQYNAEIEAKKQAKEQKKALIRQVGMLALSAALGPVINAAGAGFSAAFKGASGQGFMSQVGAGFKGIVSGGKVGNQQVGGLSNLFGSVGKVFSGDFSGAANQFKLSQIGNRKQLLSAMKNKKFAAYINQQGGISSKTPFVSDASGISLNASRSGGVSLTPEEFQEIAKINAEFGISGPELDGMFLSKGMTKNKSGFNIFKSMSRGIKGIGSIFSGAGKTGFSSLNSGFTSGPYDKYGNYVEDWADDRSKWNIKQRATGGMIPSTSGIDTVPAMLSGGEFVMNRSAVQGIGAPNLQSMNSGGTSITSEETSKELNEKLLAKLDELIGASGSTGNITINVAPSGQTSQETSQDPSASRQQLARQIKDAVLQIINDEKRIGGSLRR